MQATLLGIGVFPPPAAGADVFAHGNRPGTGRAADGRVMLVVQGVVGDVVGAQVFPHFGFGPFNQRIELPQAVVGVELAVSQVHAGQRLLTTQAGDPGLAAGQRALERLDLAHRAALFWC